MADITTQNAKFGDDSNTLLLKIAIATQDLAAGGGGAVSIADGANVAQGTTTDAPVADNTTVASGTAATGIALWKRLVNLGIAILAKLPALGTAGTASANVLSVQGIASGTALAVASAEKQYTGVPSNFAVATADATVFTLAAGEIGFIQNLDSADALAVKKGASASTSSFNFILAPGAAADDGKGGFVQIDDWVGVVSVATMTGAGRYIAYKQAA